MSKTSREKIENTIKIGVGGDTEFNTIQSALDYNTIGGETFLVHPGVYTGDTINFTANNQSIIGTGGILSAIILSTDATICDISDFTGCVISKISLILAGTTTAKPNVLSNDGDIRFKNCLISTTSTDAIATTAQSSLAKITGTGEIIFMDRSILSYDNSGAEATAIKVAFILDADSYIGVFDSALNIDTTAAGAISAVGYFGGIGEIEFTNTSIDVDDAISDIVACGYSIAGLNRFECKYCDISIGRTGAGGAIVAAFYADSANNTVMNSYNNSISISNTTTPTAAYSYYQNNVAIITVTNDVVSVAGFFGAITFTDYTIEDADFDDTDVITTTIPDTAYGLVMVRESAGTESCLYLIAAGNIEKISTDATFTVTKDNAATYNVYFETNVIKAQNRVGDNKNFKVRLISEL